MKKNKYYYSTKLFSRRLSNTVLATIACHDVFGCIPSRRFNSGIHATHDSINGMRRDWVSLATIGYTEAKSDLYDSHKLVGICIHHIIVFNQRDCNIITISLRFFLRSSVDNHCKPSFHHITISAISQV
jgi:hypothetical protein